MLKGSSINSARGGHHVITLLGKVRLLDKAPYCKQMFNNIIKAPQYTDTITVQGFQLPPVLEDPLPPYEQQAQAQLLPPEQPL